MLNELSKEIHENAVSHGWWDEPRNLLEIAALCHSEISEAVEEYRSGRPLVYHKCSAHESECAGWFMDMESHNCIISIHAPRAGSDSNILCFCKFKAQYILNQLF